MSAENAVPKAWSSGTWIRDSDVACQQETETAQVRRRFYVVMWIIYVSIVGLSTLVAIIRFAMGEDGSLHHFISTTSNYLVLVRTGPQACSYLCSIVWIVFIV